MLFDEVKSNVNQCLDKKINVMNDLSNGHIFT